jgi:hypothetical protein
MAKSLAMIIATFFACVSFMGLWFHIAAGSTRGRSLEVAVVAGVAAVIAGVAGAWLSAGEPR